MTFDRLAERATLYTKLQVYFENCLREKLDAEFARGGPDAGRNKLRTYRRFIESYTTEQYVRIIIQNKYRSAYAKFRCGVAPIKLETGRYGLNRVPVHQRLREECNVVEDECHVIMYCTLYPDIRDQFLQIMLNTQYNRSASRAMYNILNRRHCSMLQ